MALTKITTNVIADNAITSDKIDTTSLNTAGFHIDGDNVNYGNITLTGELRGPSSFIIDPAAHGDDTGSVSIKGDLVVEGTTFTANATTVDIADINLTIAHNAPNPAAADGAGITIDGAGATILYSATNDRLEFNKGLDITGTISATSVVSAPQFTFASSHPEGIPLLALKGQASAQVRYVDETDTPQTRLDLANSGKVSIVNGSGAKRLVADSNGDVSFYEPTGTTAKFVWDSGAESLSIGHNNTPQVAGIDIRKDTNTSVYVSTSDGTVTAYSGIAPPLGGALYGTITNHDVLFYVNSAEAMRIAPSGNVGIGTDTPTTPLDIKGSGTYSGIQIDNTGTTGGGFLRVKQNGVNTGIFGVSGAIVGDTSTNTSVFAETGNGITFYTNGSVSERMKIDLSGKIGINKTDPDARLHVVSPDTGNYASIFEHSSSINPNGVWINFPNKGYSANLYASRISTSNGTIWDQRLDGSIFHTAGDNTSVVFNEGSAAVDFRIESNNETHMFFLDGTSDKIAIRDSTATSALTIKGDLMLAGTRAATGDYNSDSGSIYFYGSNSGAIQGVRVYADNAGSYGRKDLVFVMHDGPDYTSATERYRFGHNGDAQILSSSAWNWAGHDGNGLTLVNDRDSLSNPNEEGTGILFKGRWWLGSTDTIRMAAIYPYKSSGSGSFGGGLKVKVQPQNGNSMEVALDIHGSEQKVTAPKGFSAPRYEMSGGYLQDAPTGYLGSDALGSGYFAVFRTPTLSAGGSSAAQTHILDIYTDGHWGGTVWGEIIVQTPYYEGGYRRYNFYAGRNSYAALTETSDSYGASTRAYALVSATELVGNGTHSGQSVYRTRIDLHTGSSYASGFAIVKLGHYSNRYRVFDSDSLDTNVFTEAAVNGAAVHLVNTNIDGFKEKKTA